MIQGGIQTVKFEKRSLSVTSFGFVPANSVPDLVAKMAEATADLGLVRSGFGAVESFGDIVRGRFALILEEAIEILIDGEIQTNTVNKIRTCEFLGGGGRLFAWGDSKARKAMTGKIAELDGGVLRPIAFESSDLVAFQDRLSVSSIAVRNPKGSNVRTVKLGGRIENYTDVNAIDQARHTVEAVAGRMEATPVGPVALEVRRAGSIKVGMEPGSVVDLPFLAWVVDRVQGRGGVEA